MIEISSGGVCPSNSGPCFPNMAGREDCDQYLRWELAHAGIPIVEGGRRKDEVPATVTGKLGPFTFDRAWYYWRVSGPMPLTIARKLYDDPVGRKDVRVAGHCGCPPPDEWGVRGIVDTYHIDTQAGLCLFARTIMAHGLHEERDGD